MLYCNTFRQLLQPSWRQPYRLVRSVGYRQQGREGGPVDWASQVLHIIALACALERSLQCRFQRQHNTGRRQLPVKSPELIGVSSGALGRLLSVGGIIASHWPATARLKLGSPQPVRCWPATVRLLQWVPGV